MKSINRRSFLKTAGAAIIPPAILPGSVLGRGGKTPNSGKINMGVVGWGAQGPANARSFLGEDDCRMVAACDVDKNHLRDAVNTINEHYGNSGVFINNMYEVQVLDFYQSKTYPDGQCGAIYGQTPPLVNACKPPGEWQTYDIIFESPRWNEQKELVKKAVVTVPHNGVVVQNRFEFLGITDGITREVPNKYGAPHPPEVFIELQYHNSSVHYRNIWIRKLGERDQQRQ